MRSDDQAIPHVCYYLFTFKRYRFSEEIDKKRFLDFVLPRISAPDRALISFLLLDDELHLEIVHMSGKSGSEEAALVRTVVQLGCRHVFTDERADAAMTAMRQDMLVGGCQILGTSRYIHRLPIRRGYAYDFRGYWWSSMLSYLGIYNWDGLDIKTTASICCPNDMQEGIRRFLAVHGLTEKEARKQSRKTKQDLS